MAEIVNLNRFRKDKKRADDRVHAAENRARFGRDKNERRIAEDERQRATREIDAKKLD